MKLKTIFFVWVLLVFSSSIPSSQELFLQANVAYKKGDFKQAVTLYEAISNKGAVVWYNLGNCWYHLNDYVQAIVCWKRAQKYDGFFLLEDSSYNCNHVYQKLAIPVSYSSFDTILMKVASYSLLFWQIIFLALLYVLLSLLYLSRKKYLYLLSLVLCCMSGTCLGIKYFAVTEVTACVKKQCCLLAGTDVRFSQLATLKAGQEVTIKEQKDNWCKIKSNGQLGWLLAENVEYI